MTEVSIIRLPRRLTAKQKISNPMTENRNANKKRFNEGAVQLANVTRRNIANNN